MQDGTVADIGGSPEWKLNNQGDEILKNQLIESCEPLDGKEKEECIREMESLY